MSSCSQSCATCPSAGSCAATTGYGGFGGNPDVTFTTMGASGADAGFRGGLNSAIPTAHKNKEAVPNKNQIVTKCSTGEELLLQNAEQPAKEARFTAKAFLPWLSTNKPTPVRGPQKQGQLSKPKSSRSVTAFPPRNTGDVITDVLRDLGLL